MIRVVHTNPKFKGTSYGLKFEAGIAATTNIALAKRMRSLGFRVEGLSGSPQQSQGAPVDGKAENTEPEPIQPDASPDSTPTLDVASPLAGYQSAPIGDPVQGDGDQASEAELPTETAQGASRKKRGA